MTDEDDTREQGVEFGDVEDELESMDYPIDHETVIERHGDAEIGLPDGSASLGEVLEPLQDEEQNYQDADELKTMVKNMVGDDAVGREGYSDRGPSTEPDDNGDDAESL
ncbi:DUF5789 family protein [Halococcus agarilyticus]|uniref:DUF5789 family protein n=1 Tax=Halococcus agarilyticus TaxID=1232219 RepID=UPI0006782FBF|nr:DUF5789 family protein [Halococcus agarilyticus]